MSKREDIVDGTDLAVWTRKFGLVYTCNAGWLDLGHLNPESPRWEIGAANLWRQVVQERNTAPEPSCLPMPYFEGAALGSIAPLPTIHEQCDSKASYKFPDGKPGYLVRYRQDTRTLPGSPGQEGIYVVKRGLTTEEKKSVALAIFVEISLRFESLQRFAEWLGIGQSGFSQEDLVSNLIGFYVAVGEVSKPSAIRACHPISKAGALAIWDREGPVGTNKNLAFTPKFAQRTGSDAGRGCRDECMGQPKRFPKMFTRIHPARRGYLFDAFPAF